MAKNENYKGFIMYQSFRKPFKMLCPKDCQTLLEAMFQYCYDDDSPQFKEDSEIALAWSFIEPLLEKQIKNYQSSSKGGKRKSLDSDSKTLTSDSDSLTSKNEIDERELPFTPLHTYK